MNMNNKQKQKSYENRQGQNNGQTQNVRQEIPDYGTKSQSQKPESGKDCHHHSGQN